MPDYRPYQGTKPDLPGNAAGLQQGFLRYPENPVKATNGTPGSGGTVTAFTSLYRPPPPPVGRNKAWQELNRRLGVDLKIQMTPARDYPQKLPALVAGNSLPDMLQIAGEQPHLAELLSAKFTDIGEHVAGNAIADYPFLANLHTDSWRTAVYNGGIYGVPVPREATGEIMYRRDDVLRKKGVNGEPKTFAEFRELMVSLTDARHSHWGCASPDGVVTFVLEMLGMPNNWREENGKFTSVYELDGMKKALSDVRALVKQGVFHPDSFTGSLATPTLFYSGQTPLMWGNYTSWSGFTTVGSETDPSLDLGGMLPPDYDGSSKAVVFRGKPAFSITTFKKASKARIKELLRICDWLSAPFGTEEYLFRKYGIEGTDYHLKGTDPVPTNAGTAEVLGSVSLLYIADAPWPIYQPGKPDVTRKDYAYSAKAIPLSVRDPTIGLFSDTQTTTGAMLDSDLADTQEAILQGHQPLSAWEDAVKHWRTGGGDKIRGEYEKSYELNH